MYLFLLQGREKIRDAIKSRRDDLRRRQEDEQDRLNCSLTTALCKSEAELIQKGSWMNEVDSQRNIWGVSK